MIKNYGNYFNSKISKLFPSKKQLPNWYNLGMKDLDRMQKEVEKKGFDKDKFLEDNKQIYAQLLT